ncbi:MAG: YybH family protein [Longimicrobiaceae bacterium]
MKFRLRGAALAPLLLLAAACATVPPAAAPVADGREAQITTLLQASADDWNRGDLDGFLAPYAAGPLTTYVGSSGLVRGKDAIRALYASSYWASGAPRGTLSFSAIEVRPLGPEHALAVGRYRVTPRDAGGSPAEGIFSLVLTRTSEGWRIVHDHSS